MLPFAPQFLGQVGLSGRAPRKSLGYLGNSYDATQAIALFDALKAKAESMSDVPGIQDALSYTENMAESYYALQSILSDKPRDYAGGPVWTEAEAEELRKFQDDLRAFQSAIDDAVLPTIWKTGEVIHDLRAEDAKAFEGYAYLKRGAQEAKIHYGPEVVAKWNADADAAMALVKSLDEQIYQNFKKVELLVPLLSPDGQAEVRKLLLLQYGIQTAAMKGRLLGSSVAMLGQAAGVECLPTKEGGKVCADGTYYPPGGGTPVNASEAPSSGVSTKTLVIGGLTLAAIAGGAVYFFTR